MDLQGRDILGEGRHHTVYIGDDTGKVIKVPKKESGITYKRACDSLGFFQRNFPREFLPETLILPGDTGFPYYVFQARVHGVLLGEFLQKQDMPQEIREQLLIFMKRAMRIFTRQSIAFDIIGTPSSEDLRNTWQGCTNFIIEGESGLLKFTDLCCCSRSINRSILLNWAIRIVKHRKYQGIAQERKALLKSLQ